MNDNNPSPSSGLPNPQELRGILKYVPLFQDRVFIIALDGRIVGDDNLPNLLLDIAVLQSLSIRVLLVFGISDQLASVASRKGVVPSDLRGFSVTDEETLECARQASAETAQRLLGKMTQANLRGALINAVSPLPVGIVKGQDSQFTGRVGKVEVPLLKRLMEQRIIPLLAPVAPDREGLFWRLNSDHLTTEVGIAIGAAKIIFLQPEPGLLQKDTLLRHLSVDELRELLEKQVGDFPPPCQSKAKHALKAVEAGIPRVHLVDGRLQQGLLSEVFSSEGVGTLIYGNEYQQVRPATRKDIRTLYNLTRNAVKREELLHRTLSELEKTYATYYLFEIDETPVACAALEIHPEQGSAEIRSLYVQPSYQHLGIGRRMVDFISREAFRKGAQKLFALSTQSYSFFRHQCGFSDAGEEDLPGNRRQSLRQSGRNSRVMVRLLSS